MKVGIIVNEFFHKELGGFGGYGFLAKNIAQYFNSHFKNGLSFKVFLSRNKRDRYVQIYHSTKVIFSPSSTNLIKRIYQRLYYQKELRWPDAFITIEFLERYLLYLLRTNRTPVIVWLQDPIDKEEWRKMESVESERDFISLSNLEKIADDRRMALREFFNQSKEKKRPVLFVTQALDLIERAKRLYGLDKIKAPLLPNPIQVPEPEVKFLEKASRPTILFLGRLDPVKRIWLFCEIAKCIPEADFLVAGITHKPEVMEPILAPYRNIPNLHFLGLVTGKDKSNLLRRSWILVNTSVHEGLPISWLEALAYKIPIVSCLDIDGYVNRFGKFVGEYWGNGYEAVPAFEQAVRNLIQDKSLRQHLAEGGFKHVLQFHTYSSFKERLFNIVKNMNTYTIS